MGCMQCSFLLLNITLHNNGGKTQSQSKYVKTSGNYLKLKIPSIIYLKNMNPSLPHRNLAGNFSDKLILSDKFPPITQKVGKI